MLKPLIAAAVLIALPGLAPAASAQAAPQAAKALTATDYATNMQSIVGQEFEGGVKIHAVKAEANTLVLTVTGPDDWSANLGPDAISGALISGFCSTAPQFFSNGVTMRVDSIDKGELAKGPLVSTCPAKAAQ